MHKSLITSSKRLENQKDEFMSIVSHELRTPTTSLKAYAQVLKKRFEKEGNAKSVELVGKMDKQINKLTSLIEDLLDVTTIEGGKLKFHHDIFYFDELVDEVIEEIQRITQQHTIIKKGVSKKKIFGDRDRIGQVITNLLTNSIKYSPDSDKILIKISADDKEVKVSVQDFGFGIDINDKPHIFERFYRPTGVKQSTYPGLGLGLYISSEIVKRHGGKMWVENKNSKGSTFTFTIPLQG